MSLTKNRTDDEGETALMAAARAGKLEIVRILLEAGADAKVANKSGATALHMAAQTSVELVTLLLDVSAEIDANSTLGTPLQWAVAQGAFVFEPTPHLFLHQGKYFEVNPRLLPKKHC